jgi:hypothetical protein
VVTPPFELGELTRLYQQGLRVQPVTSTNAGFSHNLESRFISLPILRTTHGKTGRRTGIFARNRTPLPFLGLALPLPQKITNHCSLKRVDIPFLLPKKFPVGRHPNRPHYPKART